jgi:VWFA-related protein
LRRLEAPLADADRDLRIAQNPRGTGIEGIAWSAKQLIRCYRFSLVDENRVVGRISQGVRQPQAKGVGVRNHQAFALMLLGLWLGGASLAIERGAAQGRSQRRTQPDKNKTDRKDDQSIRLGVTLVQLDVVVTDDKGRQVTELKPDDFQLLEDGRAQHISNFSYIALPTPTRTMSVRTEREGPALPERLRPEQVRRTIAFVVDDLGLSFENMPRIRTAIRKFVNERMQSGDLVAILRTGAGIGALQQFTSDKRQLLAAIERLKWNPRSRSGLTTLKAIDTAPKPTDNQLTEDASGGREDLEKLHDEVVAVGTLGTLNMVVRGLRDLPGRKSVVLLSDGIQLHNGKDVNERILNAISALASLANRSSVVFYTIDAGGLDTLNFTAADAATRSQVDLAPVMGRRDTQFQLQEGLNYLARETGGLFTHTTNDLNRGIERAIDDQQGYYLIGYVPERRLPAGLASPAAMRARPHKVVVKVIRPGYQVRSRTNFFAFSNEEVHPNLTPGQQLVHAITSPFASGAVRLKLTTLFGYDPRQGAFMRSLMHIDARDFDFETEPDGSRKGSIEIIALTFDENGQIVDQVGRSYAVTIKSSAFESTLNTGFIYTLNVPIKKPGAYQLRIAVRDARASRLGSANQFIDVPDISKHRLALSGLALVGTDPASADQSRPSDQLASGQEGAVDAPNPDGSPAVRRLHYGMYLDYGFLVYNAAVDSKTGQPRLESQIEIYKDGKPVYTGKPTLIETGQQQLSRGVEAGGRLLIGNVLVPGEYSLQVRVTDNLAPAKHRVVTQWMDFEVVK